VADTASGALDRYDLYSRRTLFFARLAVSEFGGTEIRPEHLLLGLLQVQPDLIRPHLNNGCSTDELVKSLRNEVTHPQKLAESIELPFSDETQSVLKSTDQEAGGWRAQVVTTAHVLLGLLTASGSTAQLLEANGITAAKVRQQFAT